MNHAIDPAARPSRAADATQPLAVLRAADAAADAA
jgi:hypothetical protein